MPARIVFHAGFHKTGTTSIQKTLEANRRVLEPSCTILLRRQMIGLCEAARAYSKNRTAVNLGMIQYETVETLEQFRDFGDTLLLCSEDLAGHMPGRHGLLSYAATPVILKAIIDATRALFPQAALSVYFGTRKREAWLKSCYVQHLRATRITRSLDDYMKTHHSSADLERIIDEVRHFVPVATCALEACTDTKHGPLTPLLAHLQLPKARQEQLSVLPPANTAPAPEILDKLLELNRSDMPTSQLTSAKRALLKQGFPFDKGTKP